MWCAVGSSSMSPGYRQGLAKRWPNLKTRTPPSKPVGPLVLDEDEQCLDRLGREDQRQRSRQTGTSGRPRWFAFSTRYLFEFGAFHGVQAEGLQHRSFRATTAPDVASRSSHRPGP